MIGVIVGLLGIGLVIFFHELGHLFAAKSVGITVEAFSVGWGRKAWGFTRGGTEYRVSWLPIGGFCRMQGERALIRAWHDKANRIDVEPGDFYAARPWQRIWVLVAGPLVNLLFAAAVLGTIAYIGFTTRTFENRIVLVSDFGGAPSPADEAGLQTGDYVVAVDETEIATFTDLQTVVSVDPGREMLFRVRRGENDLETRVTPALDPQSGAGRIGVYPWVDPVVETVMDGSPAAIAGLFPGDRIVAVDGAEVPHSVAVHEGIRQSGTTADLTVLRKGRRVDIRVIPNVDEAGAVSVGIAYETIAIRSPEMSVPAAVVTGFSEAIDTLVLTVRSLRLLFSGIDLTRALMGPVRITVLAGEIVTDGFAEDAAGRIISFFNFLSLVSVALCFMNLLPIPALDGGQILLSAAEGVTRRPLQPRFVYRYQVIGNVLIVLLMAFALVNDVLFFARGAL